MRVDGYLCHVAPRLSDPERAARAVIGALPSWRPGVGEEALRAKLAPGGRLLRWRSYRAAFVLDESPVGPAHVKVYTPRDPLETLIETATPSRALTSWRMGNALVAAGVATPAPLLLVTKKPLRVHRESAILTERLDGAVVLLAELKARAEKREPVRALLAGVADVAAGMHAAGFFHGDFTSRNLLLSNGRLFVIDLDRTKSVRWLPLFARRRVQLLDMRMLLLTTWAHVPRREWLRLLARYLKRAGIAKSERKAFARRLFAAKRGRVRIGASRPAKGQPYPEAR